MWKSVKPILSTVFYGLSLNFTARPWGTLVPKLAKHVSFIFSAEDQSWPNLKFQETMLSNIIWNSGEIAVWHTLFFQYVLYDISNKNIIKSQSFIIALVLQGELRTLSVLVINSVIAKCSVNWNLFVLICQSGGPRPAFPDPEAVSGPEALRCEIPTIQIPTPPQQQQKQS